VNQESLERLSSTVSVWDVMTSSKHLRRADTLEEAKNLFYEFDVVPFPRRVKIEGSLRESEGLEAPPIGWQLFALDSPRRDGKAFVSFVLLLDTYDTRLLAEALRL